MSEIVLSSPDPALAPFLAIAGRRRVPADRIVMREGEPSREIFLILSGHVTVHLCDPEGRELILASLGAREFFGEIGLFGGTGTHTAWVRTRDDCEFAVLPCERFLALGRESPELLVRLAGQMAQRLRITSERMGHLAFLDVTGRVARSLLDLGQERGIPEGSDRRRIRVTREELGRIACCSREMVSRVLQQIEGQGLIELQGREIVIHAARQE